MFSRKFKNFIISVLLCLSIFPLFSETFFTGIAGGKLKMTPEKKDETTKPAMTLQAFFSGQINFSQNAWSHMEFSIDTKNIVSETLFESTDALFQVDELSVIFRQNIETLSNYFSLFMGTYDPIGSDIFLQRQFGISPIASKITESWLGMAGSLLYPHFGVGVSDVLRFSSPYAAGLYIYVNHEDADYFVFNTDARFGGTKRFFTFDIATGIGAPLATKKYEDAVLAVEKINWHAGTTMLIGNNYTPALFAQAGVYNAIFRSTEENEFNWNELYFLIEPRFNYKGTKIHLTLFCLPQKTVDSLLFVNDKMGFNMNIFTDMMNTRNTGLDFGLNTAFTIKELALGDVKRIPEALLSGQFNLHITPYISSNFMNGELHSMLSFNFMEFFQTDWGKSLQLNVSYKTYF